MYRDLLRKLVNDSVLPQSHRANSPGRDAGFEIYVGAVCTAAQLLPVAWEEPDISCVLDGTKHVLAAKRLKNTRNLRKRVSKAVKQIERSGHPGVIVLDVGLAFNPDNHRIRQMNETVFWSEYEANFNVIIVHDYHVRQQNDGWQLAGMTIRVPAVSRSEQKQRQFNRLSTLYTYGLPNQSDASNRRLILP